MTGPFDPPAESREADDHGPELDQSEPVTTQSLQVVTLPRGEDPTGTVDVFAPPAHPADEGEQFLDEPADWAWVEEWRAGGEPVPWGPGMAVAGFTLILVASAVYVLSAGLSDRPLLGIAVNVLVAAGLGPALWLSRTLPVLRWISGGAVVGVLAAWLCALVFLA